MNELSWGPPAALALALFAAGCEAPPMVTEQTGPRGTGMAQVTNPDVVRRLAGLNIVPPAPYPLEASMLVGERASQAYQNVQVLGDLSTEEFNRLMQSITEWVSPDGKVTNGGCGYCHNAENYAADTYDNGKPIYTKVVARRMIQMNRAINVNWKDHVQGTGVTCWTCHRGNPVPVNNWSMDPGSLVTTGGGMKLMGNKRGQNTPSRTVALASLPYDAFGPYLSGDSEIRIASASQFPSDKHKVSLRATEGTYGLMMHMSQGLGVNCTYCHNSQSFRNWAESRQQRLGAWYGIRMVRNINNEYIDPLAPVFPANRKGPAGDPLKVNCTTCHQGAAKPLNGVSMLPDHPSLAGARGLSAPVTATVPVGVTLAAADRAMGTAQCNTGFRQVMQGQEVQFETASAQLSPASGALLDRLAALAGRCSGNRLAIEGHTDVTGSQAANLPLSRDRALAVANYLVGRGIDPRQLNVTGYGEARPKAGGTAPGANAVNRRIEVSVTTAPAVLLADPVAAPAAPVAAVEPAPAVAAETAIQ